MAKTKRKKIQLPTQSSDSETKIDTPPLTEEELTDGPRKTCKVREYALVKVVSKRPNVYKNFVAVVVMVEADGNLLVSFLKRVNGGTFQNGCDESWVKGANIIVTENDFKVKHKPVI